MAQGPEGKERMGVGAVFMFFSHLEKPWEAKWEGTSRRASELWNVSGTCGCIRYG